MRFKVGSEYLDLMDDEFAFTFKVNDFLSYNSREGGFSTTLKIPFTDKNNRLLNYIWDIYKNQKIESTFENEVLNIDGFIAVKNVYKTYCEANFYQGNTEWFDLIRELKISDLDFSAWNHNYSADNVFNTINTPENGICYPFVNYGRITDYGEPTTLANGLSLNYLRVDDLYPGIFYKTVLYAINKQLRIKFNGEIYEDEYFKKACLPYCGTDTPFDKSELTNRASKLTTGAYTWENTVEKKLQYLAPPGDDNYYTGILYNNTTKRYVADRYIKFKATIELNLGPYNLTYGAIIVRAKVNGSVVSESKIEINGNKTDLTTETITLDVEVQQQNYYVEFFVYFESFSLSDSYPVINSSDIKIDPYEISYEDFSIVLNDWTPDIKLTDFFKEIASQFGIIYTYEPISNTVTLNSFNTVYKNIGKNFVDWSQKLGGNSRMEFKFNNYGQKSILQYTEDTSDPLNVSDYGSGFFQLEDTTLNDQATIYKSIFAPTFVTEIYTQDENRKVKIPFINKLVLQDDGTFENSGSLKQRILFVNRSGISQLKSTYTQIEVLTRTGLVGYTSINFAWFIKPQYEGNVNNLKQNFDFGFNNTNADNLLATYLKGIYKAVKNPVLIREEIYLNDLDIQTLDFMKPIYLHKYREWFYLNAVNEYIPGKGRLTEIELIKL